VLIVSGAVPVSVAAARTVHNPGWHTGMGSSLAAGLRALRGDGEGSGADDGDGSGSGSDDRAGAPQAAVIALADQPLVGAESVRRLIAAYLDGAGVAVAAYDGKPRNPVLIAREHWPAVLELATGDSGARPFLRANPDLVTVIECGDTGRPDDVDTAADLARITRCAKSS
jgi:nicotine blue oxidoreductase